MFLNELAAALQTKKSSRPNFSATAANNASMSSGCSTSARTVIAWPPACSTCSRTCSASSAFFL